MFELILLVLGIVATVLSIAVSVKQLKSED